MVRRLIGLRSKASQEISVGIGAELEEWAGVAIHHRLCPSVGNTRKFSKRPGISGFSGGPYVQ